MAIDVFSAKRIYRPLVRINLHADLLGNPNNSNFTNGLPELKIYLSELPSVSFSNAFDTNNGAKLSNALARIVEGNIAGVSFGEIIQNFNNRTDLTKAFVPPILTGPSSFRVLKSAQKLNLTLKCRVQANHPNNKLNKQSSYTDVLDALLRLTMPCNASRFNFQSVTESLKNTFSGITNAPDSILDAASDVPYSKILGNTLDSFKYAGKGLKYAVGLRKMDNNQRANAEGELKVIQDKIKTRTAEIEKILDDSSTSGLIAPYIYREYITLDFEHVDDYILRTLNAVQPGSQGIKFILKSFEATQSNQLANSNGLQPLFVDFTLNLESLGVIFKPISSTKS